MESRRACVVGVVLMLGCLTAPALWAMSVDDALEQLRGHTFGQDDEVLNTLGEAAVRSHGDPAVRRKLAQGLAGILDTDAAYDAKQFACRQLALIGTEKQVPVLAKLLADKEMSQMARYALARIPGETVDRALLDALEQTDGRNKLGVINTLGSRRSDAGVDKLAALLDSEQADVATEAARALGRTGSPGAARALARALAGGSPANGDVLADACLRCADHLLAAGQAQSAAGMYKKILNPSQPSHIRAAALRGLTSAVPAEEAVSLVNRALSSSDRQLQKVAARIAQEIPGSEATRTLAAQLPKLPPATQLLLLQALAVRGDRAALPAVAKAYNSSETTVRVAAIGAAGAVGDASSVWLLAEWAARGNAQERASAAKSLIALRGTDIDTELVAQLRKVLPNVRVEIIKALAARNATGAVFEVLNAVGSKDAAVRGASIRALRDLARAEHVPALVDVLIAVDAADRSDVRKTLVAVARRSSSEEQAAKSIVARQATLRDVERRSALLAALGDLGQSSGLSALRGALKDDNAQIRRTGIIALSAWPNAEAMDDLLEVARQAENDTHRVLALRGYIDLVGRAGDLSADRKLTCYESAMKLASDAAEKRKIFAALSDVKTIEAMQFALAFLEDEQVKQEAALAVTTIAASAYGQDTEAAGAALEKVAAGGVNENVKQQARKTLDEIDAVKSYLLDWEVAGPYVEKGKSCTQLFDIPFGPELQDAQVQWRRMPVTTQGEQVAYLDLLKELNGGEQRVAYVRTQFESAEQKTASLEIFSDDGVKAWLNGQVVHANNTTRPIMPEPDRVRVTLKKGVNHLMLKVTQNNLPWGAIVRVREAKVPEPKLGKGFRLHIINADSRFEPAGILDVNRDGKLDIFCGGFWYEAPSWKKHFVREVPEQGGYYYDFANLPMDVDGDGWTDIANAAWHNKTVFWVRNPGERGGPWDVFDIDAPGNMETAMAFDINGDGQLDVLPNIMNQAAWYEFHKDASAAQGVTWEKHALPQEAAGHGLGAGDVNRDGRCDVVTPRGWLEQLPDGWTWHPEFELGHASIPILVHDVDDDGDADIIWGLGHNYGLSWLEQKPAQERRSWDKHLIDDSWSQPHYMLMADLDGDGKDELVTGKRHHAHNGNDPGGNDPICVYYYDFDRSTGKWTRHTMHEGGRVGFGINTAVADMDGDGDIDVVAPGKSGLYLFENLLN